MFYQLQEAYILNKNNGKATVAGTTKKLATSTLNRYSFEKLANHAHSYAKANCDQAVHFDGHTLTCNREITEKFGRCFLNARDRKLIVNIITYLYNNG